MLGRRLERQFDRYRRRGDVASLGRVFDAVAPEVLGVAMHLARGPVEAEDLLQRTFVTAIERAKSFDASERLVPWLLGILANHARQEARRARRTPDPQRLPERESADPQAAAEQRESLAVLDRALDGLSDPARSVLVLRYRHGMEPAAIADALGWTPGGERAAPTPPAADDLSTNAPGPREEPGPAGTPRLAASEGALRSEVERLKAETQRLLVRAEEAERKLAASSARPGAKGPTFSFGEMGRLDAVQQADWSSLGEAASAVNAVIAELAEHAEAGTKAPKSTPKHRLKNYTYAQALVAGEASAVLVETLLAGLEMTPEKRTSLLEDPAWYVPRLLAP